jgi:hypothetical protein
MSVLVQAAQRDRFTYRRTAVAASVPVPILTQIFSLVPCAAGFIFLVLSLFAGGFSAHEQWKQRSFEAAMRDVPVKFSLPRPEPTQESVELAVAAFGIDRGGTVAFPLYDASLADRGLTAGGTLDVRRSVWVGSAAFVSWGVLGSTLGHEIEIHGQQSFVSILALDGVADVRRGLAALVSLERADASMVRKNSEASWGTWRAERTAYLYEIRSAKRFGLTSEEVASIHQVMDYYYPVHEMDRKGAK